MFLLLRRSVIGLLMMTIITGVVYPAVVTAIGHVVFPHRSQGSLIVRGDEIVGSELIGQPFDSPKYFWPRPSATDPVPYNAGSSSGSNLGPTNPKLLQAVQERVARLKAVDPNNRLLIPVDLVTASGSGLEAYISPAAAQYQVPRVARARGLTAVQVQQLVTENTWGRQWGFLGEPRTNVVTLNLALDKLSK
ncbi:MAG: potassium-transporting ATPase subunit KdpC [Phycisphaerae bacterium]|nr:potassium-transporting ATPase subunit KdpC [Phycisphaerae bacterium]